jgi:hypothetical protein
MRTAHLEKPARPGIQGGSAGNTQGEYTRHSLVGWVPDAPRDSSRDTGGPGTTKAGQPRGTDKGQVPPPGSLSLGGELSSFWLRNVIGIRPCP